MKSLVLARCAAVPLLQLGPAAWLLFLAGQPLLPPMQLAQCLQLFTCSKRLKWPELSWSQGRMCLPTATHYHARGGPAQWQANMHSISGEAFSAERRAHVLAHLPSRRGRTPANAGCPGACCRASTPASSSHPQLAVSVLCQLVLSMTHPPLPPRPQRRPAWPGQPR